MDFDKTDVGLCVLLIGLIMLLLISVLLFFK